MNLKVNYIILLVALTVVVTINTTYAVNVSVVDEPEKHLLFWLDTMDEMKQYLDDQEKYTEILKKEELPKLPEEDQKLPVTISYMLPPKFYSYLGGPRLG